LPKSAASEKTNRVNWRPVGRPASFLGERNDVSENALFDLKKSEVCHEANASADENRRLAEVQIEKAAELPTGSTKESHLKKARDYESSAHSDDWRNAHLQAPD